MTNSSPINKYVEVVLKERLPGLGFVLHEGDKVYAEIMQDGSAKTKYPPKTTIAPEKYDIYITDEQYNSLLDNGDKVV